MFHSGNSVSFQYFGFVSVSLGTAIKLYSHIKVNFKTEKD